MSEDILYHIMSKLQMRTESLEHFDILKDNKFWNIILNATGNVKKLNSNPFVKRARTSIKKLDELIPEKSVDLQLLQQTLEYSDEKLFQRFDLTIGKKKALSDYSQDEIVSFFNNENNEKSGLKEKLSDLWERSFMNNSVNNLPESKPFRKS